MKGHRVWKIIKAIGVRAGVSEIYLHAFRHSSGAGRSAARRHSDHDRAHSAHTVRLAEGDQRVR